MKNIFRPWVALPNKATNPHWHISVTSVFLLNPKWNQKRVALPNKSRNFLLIYIKYINININIKRDRKKEERERNETRLLRPCKATAEAARKEAKQEYYQWKPHGRFPMLSMALGWVQKKTYKWKKNPKDKKK